MTDEIASSPPPRQHSAPASPKYHAPPPEDKKQDLTNEAAGYGGQPLLQAQAHASAAENLAYIALAYPGSMKTLGSCPHYPPRKLSLALSLLAFFSCVYLFGFHTCSLLPWRSCPSPAAKLDQPAPSPAGVYLRLPSPALANTMAADGEESKSFCPAGRVYVYDLPPQFNADLLLACSSLVPWADLCPALDNNGIGRPLDMPSWLGTGFWYFTSQFGGEVLYHAKMLVHPCRTRDEKQAAAFFVPFYAGLDVARYLFVPSTAAQTDELSHDLLRWLKMQKAWKKNGGRDHFMVIGRITWDFRREESSLWDRLWGRSGWGSDFFLTPEMRNGPLRLTIEKDLADKQEIAVPYPTSFHPSSDSELAAWQGIVRTFKRSNLFSYAGGSRSRFADDFRGVLLEQCRSSAYSGPCRSVDCSEQRCEHPLPAMELFLDSVFCLQPRGDSYTRRSIFDSMVAGCIPVFFWHRSAYLQYGWHLPPEEDSYSVFIDRKEVRKGKRIEDVLKGFSERRIRKMRENLIATMPRVIYTPSTNCTANFRDAFDIAIDGVLEMVRQRVGSTRYALNLQNADVDGRGGGEE